jgi:hypothetical protein
VRANLELGATQGDAFRIQRALFKLGDVPTRFADHVMMMVFSELVACPVPQVEATHDPKLA